MPVAEREVLTTVTQFTRSPGEWLKKAAQNPVSITRPKRPSITMVNREAWQEAASSSKWLSVFSAIVKYAVERINGEQNPSCPADFGWLSLFEPLDVREFVNDLSGALNGVMQGLRPWDDVDAVVEEWRRSAVVLNDSELRRRFEETIKDIRG